MVRHYVIERKSDSICMCTNHQSSLIEDVVERLGDISRVRVVVVEIAVLAITGFRLVEERLECVVGDLLCIHLAFRKE